MADKQSILIKFYAAKNYIELRTITRKYKSPQSFFLSRPSFADLKADGKLLLKDGNSFAEFKLINDGSLVQINFTWISQSGNNNLKGYIETVILDYDKLAQAIWNSSEKGSPKKWSMLSKTSAYKFPQLDFSSQGAQKTIKHILKVPVLRHKFTKAVRDNFQWPSYETSVIRFYADWEDFNFSFDEEVQKRHGISGGLILHKPDGLKKAYYEVHT